jgi:hypothetical protein
MKTKIIALMLMAGASAFAQGQFGQDVNGGPDYNSAQGNPGYDDPANGSPSYNEPQSYGGAPEYYSQAPAGAYGAPPLCAPGTVWIDGYDGVDGYCAVPPYSGAFWIGPRYFGGRFVAGYWSGPRGFVGGRGFRGDVGFGRNDFRSGGAFVERGFAGNNFRHGGFGGQGFTRNNDHRSGAQGARPFSGGSNFRGGAPSGRSSGGFSRSGGGRTSDGGHSGSRHR